MAESRVVVDAFKFMALRPPQVSSAEAASHTIIRDSRAKDERGRDEIAAFVRPLAQREEARHQWGRLDLAALRPFAEAHPKLLTAFARPDAETDRGRVLEAAGLSDAQARGAFFDRAWEALYVAYYTGPDAGQRLELPLAALRVLHFLQGTADSETIDADQAQNLLSATPAIPQAALHRNSQSAEPPRGLTRADGSAERHEAGVQRMRDLISEYESTQKLLKSASVAQATVPRVTKTGQLPGGANVEGQALAHLKISTVPTVGEAIGITASGSEGTLLRKLSINGTTALPIATNLLQQHSTMLTERAMEMRNSPQFMTAMKSFQDSSLMKIAPGKIGTNVEAGWDLVAQPDPSTAPNIDTRGMFRPLGIGDLKVVKQTLVAYEAGEVAHIENVLKGESKERTHRALDRVENIVFTSEEETTETERDTQTTDRFELKREAEQTIKEDMSVQAGVTVTGSYGPVEITAHGDFAYSTSKQESQKSSSNYARDVIDRSVSKVQKKVKTERTTKTLSEVEEINGHKIENVPGTGHVIGIYRWVDKRYRAQVYNYGVRLMMEFVVPEPAAFYRAARIRQLKNVTGAHEPEPFVDMAGKPLTVAAITPNFYANLASRYNTAGVTPPPPEWVFLGTAIGEGGLELGKTTAKAWKDLTVPEGYELRYYEVGAGIIWKNHPNFILQVGGDMHHVLKSNHSEAPTSSVFGAGTALWADLSNPLSTGFSGVVPLSVAAYDVTGYSVNLEGAAARSPAKYYSWQLQTFEKIQTAYIAARNDYDQKMKAAEAAAGIGIEGRNPAINREIEKRELKKLCVTMLTGQHFSEFDAMTDPFDKPAHHPEVNITEAVEEGRIAQFFEQAFEWEHLTYLFYPYFWGRKANWVSVTNESDPDPLFTQFLQAGAARVLIPVRPSYRDDVQYFLQSTAPDYADRIWRGGGLPTLDTEDERYVSIADELRNRTDDLADATPEDEPWEFTIPTTLVWLQEDSKLPSYP
ncbi:hypothetical protein [Mesorhizobium sp.]|uniref:hypothetical protein n=1 Tax=Mesorhizobium sp. TaxID=1871066 RepID=UPI000FE2F459|nr:hypothetical protein [Mesorhizobium sp.]RWD30150.1 MAG: hypothetical protein EOS34_26900 [Mesorhizobium sp.]RWD81595.1 MAG: hypothetical protein EOS48_14760 [Mesorhizobium sp.]RWN57952.1 MAG: hypothetical protein EOR98_03640 [Mesorhizobium sp.]RWN78956.1 MAG: hypothetical protein EOS02_05100 [Mesorhizobium sp.]RWN84515.1 MAG: hypothetical protein EOS01_00430 [Mesorhizobium sp.]